jgi:hypothetical protein
MFHCALNELVLNAIAVAPLAHPSPKPQHRPTVYLSVSSSNTYILGTSDQFDASSIPDQTTDLFLNLPDRSSRITTLRLSQSLTEMGTRNVPGCKG